MCLSQLLCIICITGRVFAQLDQSTTGPFRLPLKPIDQNHSYSASTECPIGKALNRSNAARKALTVIVRHFENEAERVCKLVQTPPKFFIEERVQACNIPDGFSHIASVNMTTSSYGWGVLGLPCTTELATNLDREVIFSMKKYISELKKVGQQAVRAAGLNWSKAVTYMEFKYKGDFEWCSLLHFTAFRVNGTWGINTGLTNAEINIFKEEWHRHYLVEVLRTSSDGLRATRFTLPRRPPGYGWVHGASSVYSTWGGQPQTSLFRTIMVAANNPAVIAAIAVGHDTKEQVQDATTKSNMAILFLPLMLAVIPIALFADVSTVVTVGYAVLTDVMSAMPLAIKGIELLNFGNVKQIATRTWIYGGRTQTDLTAGETWHATCTANRRFIVQGRIFLGLAVLLMLVGGALEIYSKKSMEKRKNKDRESRRLQRPQLWEYSVCRECNCMEEYARDGSSQ